MRPITLAMCLVILSMVIPLSGCQGIFNDIYDEPEMLESETRSGRLFIDASDWEEWHYIDFKRLAEAVSKNPTFNTSSLWVTYKIPVIQSDNNADRLAGIYTYWYDVFGVGISKYEFRGFLPTQSQEAPDEWDIAVHRNNVRTNAGAAFETAYSSLDELPDGTDWLSDIQFVKDEWNQTDVWSVQDKMLSGIIGNQGISINNVLGRWLTMEIPPMPPTFMLNRHVFIVQLSDGSYAAIQLADYISADGTKCCLTINYKYPL